MNKIKVDVTLNHGLYSSSDFREYNQEICLYSFVKSRRTKRIYLMASARKKKMLSLVYIIVLPAWLLLMLLLPIKWYFIILLWMFVSFFFSLLMYILNKKTRKSLQFFPLMILDPQKETITFLRKKTLAYLQILSSKETYRFSEIVKSQVLLTFVLRNNSNGPMILRYQSGSSILILCTKKSSGEEENHMIFAAIAGQGINNRVAELLNKLAGIPIERKFGSILDPRRS